MKTKPILFSTPMVQAILEGRKTQTRRIIKGFPTSDEAVNLKDIFEHNADYVLAQSPYGIVGDILWVRETWFPTRYDFKELLQSGITSLSKGNIIKYKADNDYDPIKDCVGRSWKPSIFMPKEACRLFLEVTKVRVERLQDISERDAKCEGAKKGILREGPNTQKGEFHLELNNHSDYKSGFQFIWQSINGKESWNQNPWVWVYDFKKVERPENFIQ